MLTSRARTARCRSGFPKATELQIYLPAQISKFRLGAARTRGQVQEARQQHQPIITGKATRMTSSTPEPDGSRVAGGR